MIQRERPRDECTDHGGTSSGSGEGLRHLREAGEELLAAGDDIVTSLLSGDSVEFLKSMEQEGGE